MGTNFYWAGEDREADGAHLGKRSAAGHYCWSCRRTLCPGGPAQVHRSDRPWPKTCSVCGQSVTPSDTFSTAMALELGFAQARTEAPAGGIHSCSSFTWALPPDEVRQRCQASPFAEIVEDEYGRRYTGAAFLAMLDANCPLEFCDQIGRDFS